MDVSLKQHKGARVGQVSVTTAAMKAIASQGHGWLRVRAGAPGRPSPELVDVVLQAMAQANIAELHRTDDDPEVGGSHVAVSADAVLVFIDFCDTRVGMRAWCEVFAEGLAGLDGPVQVGSATSVPLPGDGRDLSSTAMALTLPLDQALIDADEARYGAGAPGWHVDPERTEALLEVLLPWCLTDAHTCYLRSGLFIVTIDPDSALPLIRAALPRVDPVTLATTDPHGAVRQFALCTDGHVSAQRYDPAATDMDATADLEALLVACAGLVDYGMIRRGQVRRDSWHYLVNNDHPLIPSQTYTGSHLRQMRPLEATHVPDVYAIQLLTDQHLAHGMDLTGWDVRQVAPGRHLVSTPAAAAWLHDPHGPPAAMLEAARHQFAPALITADMVKP